MDKLAYGKKINEIKNWKKIRKIWTELGKKYLLNSTKKPKLNEFFEGNANKVI